MKKMKFVLMSAMAILAMALTMVGCEQMPWTKQQPTTLDTAVVKQMIQEWDNPTFGNVQEVILCKEEMLQYKEEEAIFLSMPNEVIQSVCKVLLKRRASVNISDIVSEYQKHREVYNSLSDGKTPIPPDPVAPTQKSIDSTKTAPV